MDPYKNLIVSNDAEASKVTGKSFVDHAIRVSLGLNCNEFIVMMFLEEHPDLKESDNIKNVVYASLGMSMNEFNSYLISITYKGFANGYSVSEKWKNAFKLDLQQFEKLWALFHKKGTKEIAKTRFAKVIKMISFDELFLRGQTYQKNVAHKELEFRLGLDTYLQPDKKRWMNIESTPVKETKTSYAPKFFK